MADAYDRLGCRERGRHGRGCAHDQLRRERDRGTARASVLFYAGRDAKSSGWAALSMSEEFNYARRRRGSGTDQFAARVEEWIMEPEWTERALSLDRRALIGQFDTRVM